MAKGRYVFLRETKNYFLYEPNGPGDLLGNLYVDKTMIDKADVVIVSVEPFRGKG